MNEIGMNWQLRLGFFPSVIAKLGANFFLKIILFKLKGGRSHKKCTSTVEYIGSKLKESVSCPLSLCQSYVSNLVELITED